MILKEAIKEYYDFLTTTPWSVNPPHGWWNRWDRVIKHISLTTMDCGRFIVDDIRFDRVTPNAPNAPLAFEKGRFRYFCLGGMSGLDSLRVSSNYEANDDP
jgi:hypothetical protein